MKPIIIANWKMNLTLQESIQKATMLNSLKHSSKLLVAASIPYISYLSENFPDLTLCGQNISAINGFGAYTGEYSAEMLKSCGVDYCVIGHSERRTTFSETNKIVKQKALSCIESKITPIICVGETLESRQNKNYKEFIAEQIQESIPETLHPIIIAYEPVWAIGSGMVPTPQEIMEIFAFIKTDERISLIAKNAELVYGGSVNSKNFKEILDVKYNNGVILGSASLDEKELNEILTLK